VISLGDGSGPEAAARAALEAMLVCTGARGGVIVVDASGHFGLARTTETMPWGFACEGGVVESAY
jgi:isoaspartyl peptidase/L-asparaginase-like protein (Ntn-hydrolase superfamily)